MKKNLLLWKLSCSNHFPPQISVSTNTWEFKVAFPQPAVIWHLLASFPSIPSPVVSSLPQSRLQRTEALSYVQDPNFPASAWWAKLLSARKQQIWNVTIEKIQAINTTELLDQVLLPKVLFYTRVANEYGVHVIQDAEVLREHIC